MKKRISNEIIFGLRPIIEAIESGKSLVKVFFKKGLKGDLFQECFKVVRAQKIPFQYVPVEKLNYFTHANHQGCVAIISPIPYQQIEIILPGLYESGVDPFLLVLDGLTDIRNFGAIARTAEAAGIHAIIVGSKKAAMINSDAIKTSAGALNNIPICREDRLEDTLDYLHNSGIKLIGASEKASDYFYDIDYKGPLAIVMGSEDEGISPQIFKQLDNLVKIPMHGAISSLNVSVAAGIIIYEALRQKI